MLLPSPFTCDSSQPRLQAALFASPPASPPQLSTQNAIGNIFNTCRSLQSLLAAAPPPLNPIHISHEPVTPPTSSHAQLMTPPMVHAANPQPLKLRLRSRKPEPSSLVLGAPAAPKKRIVKRSAVIPTRGVNKRRRALDDDMGREVDEYDEDVESDLDIAQSEEQLQHGEEAEEPERPQTPKRARIAPEVLPLGLERADYHAVHLVDKLFGSGEENQTASNNADADDNADVAIEKDGEEWSTEEDRILVELVLEKLKLSKSEWQDCARSLGKDRGSVGRRWKSLMINGEIGLKRNSRRGKIHGTWR